MPIFTNRVMDQVKGSRPSLQGGDPTAVLKRAQMLGQQDRLLVELSLQGRLTRGQLSEVFGIRPGTVTRRLQRLSARLYDPLVIDLVDDACPLAPEYRQVGVEHFLLRRSVGSIAERHRLYTTQVRAMLHYVRGWHRGVRTKREWRE